LIQEIVQSRERRAEKIEGRAGLRGITARVPNSRHVHPFLMGYNFAKRLKPLEA
jgi:hypothetical protein